MYKEKVGLIGGFGGYATLNFYRRFLEVFATGSERDYPHLIIDNNFTMPSRTRALLYGDDYEQVVDDITCSVQLLLEQDVSYIVLICGTAHAFLDDVYKKCPEAINKVLSILDVLSDELKKQQIGEVSVIAAEGTLQKGVYSKNLGKHTVSVYEPDEQFYPKIRYFIECVKQNKLTMQSAYDFIDFACFISNKQNYNLVLGCTEFPALIEYINSIDLDDLHKEMRDKLVFFDPLELTLMRLKTLLV